jgi:pyruvate dehydrogenase E2 component (dihydrolipoamide acetyltransferase)
MPVTLTDLLMPKLGLTMTEGTIAEWLKKPGDRVEKGEPIFLFETEKSALEFEAPADGFLVEIRTQPGETVPCYTVVGLIADALPTAADAAQSTPVDATPGAVPQAAGLPPGRAFRASPRAKKAARDLGIDLTAITGSGPLHRIVEADVLDAHLLAPAHPPPSITPVARRVAAAAAVDLTHIAGSGRDGKVTKADILAAAQPAQDGARGTAVSAMAAAPAPAPDLSAIQPFSAIRAITARRMTESAQQAPQVTLTTEADAVALISARAQLNAIMGGGSGAARIAYNALLMAICAQALREHPALNGAYTPAGLKLNDAIHIGIAVDTDRGLLVPVIPDVGTRKLASIQAALDERIGRARAGKAPPSDFEGGTFTISNLGMYAIDAFTPIVNLPQAAILGVGRITPRVVPWEGAPAIREQMALSLSFDHRAVDGGPAARFLKRIKDLIEAPLGLLLG